MTTQVIEITTEKHQSPQKLSGFGSKGLNATTERTKLGCEFGDFQDVFLLVLEKLNNVGVGCAFDRTPRRGA
jgi:hypothetical protein